MFEENEEKKIIKNFQEEISKIFYNFNNQLKNLNLINNEDKIKISSEIEEIEFTTTPRLIATSTFILIPKKLLDSLKLGMGDRVDVIISKHTKKYFKFECRVCGHIFEMDDDEPYCPACSEEKESLKKIDEIFITEELE